MACRTAASTRGVAEVDQGVLVDLGDRGQECDVEVAADDRPEGEDAFGVGTEPGEAPADDLADADGEPDRRAGRRR